MTIDRKGQTSSIQLYAEVIFAKDNNTLMPKPIFLDHDYKKSH